MGKAAGVASAGAKGVTVVALTLEGELRLGGALLAAYSLHNQALNGANASNPITTQSHVLKRLEFLENGMGKGATLMVPLCKKLRSDSNVRLNIVV